MQKLELTLAIIKPHAVSNPVVRSFIRNILKNKFIIVKTKRLTLDTDTACRFYEEHVGKFFYNRLTTFMASERVCNYLSYNSVTSTAHHLLQNIAFPDAGTLIVEEFSCGCIDLHVLGHINAIQLWRRLLGPTSVYKGQFQNPYCLRGMFGISDTRNVAHGSDSQDSAEREIKFFFPEFSFYHWRLDDEEWFRKGPIVFNDHFFQHVKKLA